MSGKATGVPFWISSTSAPARSESATSAATPVRSRPASAADSRSTPTSSCRSSTASRTASPRRRAEAAVSASFAATSSAPAWTAARPSRRPRRSCMSRAMRSRSRWTAASRSRTVRRCSCHRAMPTASQTRRVIMRPAYGSSFVAPFGDVRRLSAGGRGLYGGGMIEVKHLTKRYRRAAAVEDLSFTVRPGRVTGFLGPNGAGKSTTVRLILGLDRPTSGTALVHGRPYAELRRPLTRVGALLEAGALHPGRSARAHLLWLAKTNRLPASRVGEVLEEVGLAGVAGKAARAFSLGMRQRLGVAAALLGDPDVLVLDE